MTTTTTPNPKRVEAARRGWEKRRANGYGRHTEASKAKMALSMMDRWLDPDYRERVTEAAAEGLRASWRRRREAGTPQ